MKSYRNILGNRFAGFCCCALLALAMLVLPTSAQAFEINLNKLKNTATKIKRATGEMPQEEEVEIGGLVTSNLLGAAPLVDSADVQAYVNKIGLWVALQSERPNLPWRFGVIDSDNINAFAAPGGYIVMTRGLFMSLNSEAELAGVLGHEIGHVVRKHHLEALKKNARLDLFGDVLQVAAKKKNKKERKRLDKVINAGTQLYARGLDREDEFEADRLGVVYAARAGYDPYALLNVLTTLDSMNAASPQLGLLTKTHPPFALRLQQLDGVMDARLNPYAGQLLLPERLAQMQFGLVGK
jgi:predicted Zn-dependent protease